MAKKVSRERVPRHYRKPLLLVGVPLFVTALWFAIGFLLIISGLVIALPTQDAQLLSPADYQQHLADMRESDVWSTFWFIGLAIIFIGSLISSSMGTLRIVQHRQTRHR